MLRPHPLASHIRTLELNFTDQNDHLFLQQIIPWDGEGEADAGVGSSASAAVDNGTTPGRDETAGDSSKSPVSPVHDCSTPRCCFTLYGQQLLDQILDGIREQIPNLKDLAITITGRMEHGPILDRFAYIPDEDTTSTDTVPAPTDAAAPTPSTELSSAESKEVGKPEEGSTPDVASQEAKRTKWELQGNLHITFEAEGTRYHVHKGGKLARRGMRESLIQV